MKLNIPLNTENVMDASPLKNRTAIISITVTSVLLFYMVLLPWQPSWIIDITLYDFRRVSQIILLIFYPCMMLCSKIARAYVINTWNLFETLIKYAIALFFLLGLLSSYNAIAPLQGLLFVSQYWLLFIMALYIAGLCQAYPKTLRYLFITIAIISTLYAFLTICNHLFILLDSRQHDHRFIFGQTIYPNFMNIRFLNHYITWVLPLLILPLLQKNRTRKITLFFIFLTAYWWYLAIASGSRAFILEWLAIILFLTIFYRAKAIPFLKWHGLCFIIGFILYFLLFISPEQAQIINIPRGFDSNGFSNGDSRFTLWQIAWESFSQHPWLGIGPGNFPLYGFQSPLGADTAHPHSFPIMILSEWGLLSALLLTTVCFIGLLKLLALSNKTDMAYVLLAFCLIAGFVHSLLSGILVMPLSQTLLAIIVGTLLTAKPMAYRNTPTKKTSVFSSYSEKLILLASIATMLYLLIYVIIALPKIAQYNKTYTDTCVIHYTPNYWILGWVTADNLLTKNHLDCPLRKSA